MITNVRFFQWFTTSTILLLILLQMANSTRNEVQTVRSLKDNPIKDILFHDDQTDNARETHIIIKRQSDRYRYTPRPESLPILVGGGGIGGFGRGFGPRGAPGRGFGARSVGARGFGARGLGGRGIGGLGGRGRG
ncbi:PREDICTED: uncharacterized protein LOC106118920 [Papilio xuthus]|uniref:Uncharacterized protein LOC106118920 n=1 Tax=Papilio xuthus TaxID=66420 RepID=A0AAJ6ZBT7_PAPXU|nr:PREDICTED: uncharacterized protein LOC106118920 [Papilio xuthus]